jgi:hypothetical protein
LKKLNADLRCSPAIAFLGVYPELKQGLEWYLDTDAQSSTIHSRQKAETI